jgi:hypothetical protein
LPGYDDDAEWCYDVFRNADELHFASTDCAACVGGGSWSCHTWLLGCDESEPSSKNCDDEMADACELLRSCRESCAACEPLRSCRDEGYGAYEHPSLRLLTACACLLLLCERLCARLLCALQRSWGFSVSALLCVGERVPYGVLLWPFLALSVLGFSASPTSSAGMNLCCALRLCELGVSSAYADRPLGSQT